MTDHEKQVLRLAAAPFKYPAAKTYAHLWPSDDARAAALTDGLVRLDTHDSLMDSADAE